MSGIQLTRVKVCVAIRFFIIRHIREMVRHFREVLLLT